MAKKTKLTSGNDSFAGSSVDDLVLGGAGDDNISGGAGNDVLKGGSGNDTLRGGAGDDKLNGGAGDDRLLGGIGDDTLVANKGNDEVNGGDGDDLVIISGNFADAVVKEITGGYEITTAAGTITVKNTELFQFDDQTVSVDDIMGPDLGEEKNLTVGQDNISGTAGDDTYTAAPINPVSGTAATTLNAFDTVDGGDGNDTLNIFVDGSGAGFNYVQQGTVKNIETVNVYGDATNNRGLYDATSGDLDVAKFVGASQVWQIGYSEDFNNADQNVTVGFRNIDGQSLYVEASDAATGVKIALDGVTDTGNSDTYVQVYTDSAANTTLADVTISGTVIDGDKSDTEAGGIDLDLYVGKGVTAVTLNTAIDADIGTLNNNYGASTVASFDASASTGAISYDAAGYTGLASVKTGTGADTIRLTTATVAAAVGVTAVSASVSTGDGKDTVTIATTGTGTTTVDSGLGDDTVTITSRSDGKLSVSLGDGSDTFAVGGGVAINGTDSIDAGAGSDTLTLQVVGAANIGAFSNFDVFDVAGLDHNLDLAILATKNTVTEIVASDDLAADATLLNLGAGVGFRATAAMGTGAGNILTLTQATAGALSISLDATEAVADAALDTVDAEIVASNATSLNVSFASDFADKLSSYANTTELTLTGGAATTLTVVSGGTETTNVLDYTDSSAAGALTTVTVSGSQALSLDLSVTVNKVTSVNASALTGALTFDTADLKAESVANAFDGGKLALGSGDDVITVSQGAVISNIEKASGETVTVQSNFDLFDFGAAKAQIADIAATATYEVSNGELVFLGAGPATLADAISTATTALAVDAAANEVVVFEYLGDSYIVEEAGDIVKLDDVTGLNGLNVIGGDVFLF